MSPDAPGAAIDRQRLAALASDVGREAAVKIVQTFLQELGARLGEIASGDAERVRRAAHPLKSGAALVGAEQLSRVAALAEAGADNAAEVEAATRAAEGELRAWLSDFAD